MAQKSINLAVLVDGDNVSPKHLPGLMAEIANYGTASVRRIYGDWTKPDLKNWKQCLHTHSFSAIQQFAYTSGKNSTDGAMIIDAMDILYKNRVSGFVIVSSDSDFIRLAGRIREEGVTVYGFGERNKTSPFFVAACDKFVYFDSLTGEGQDDAVTMGPPHANVSTPAQSRMLSIGNGVSDAGVVSRPVTGLAGRTLVRPDVPERRPLDREVLKALYMAVSSCSGYDGDYANLAEVGNYLRRLSPDLNPRNYGYDKLREFVEASGLVDVRWKKMGDNPPVAMVCLK